MITIAGGDVVIDGELQVRVGTGVAPLAGDIWTFISSTDGSLTGEYLNLGQGDTVFQRGGVIVTINYAADGITFEAGKSNAIVPGAAGLGIFGLGGIIRRRRRKN